MFHDIRALLLIIFLACACVKFNVSVRVMWNYVYACVDVRWMSEKLVPLSTDWWNQEHELIIVSKVAQRQCNKWRKMPSDIRLTEKTKTANRHLFFRFSRKCKKEIRKERETFI